MRKGKVIYKANKANSLARTKWMCKYHIVFTPKYRRKIIFNQNRESLKEIIKLLCKYKGVEILEGHRMPDHVHLLVSIPPKIRVSSFMVYLKGKSARMMFDKHANLKYKFETVISGQRDMMSVRLTSMRKPLKKYIQDQETHDIVLDKLSVKEYRDPFLG